MIDINYKISINLMQVLQKNNIAFIDCPLLYCICETRADRLHAVVVAACHSRVVVGFAAAVAVVCSNITIMRSNRPSSCILSGSHHRRFKLKGHHPTTYSCVMCVCDGFCHEWLVGWLAGRLLSVESCGASVDLMLRETDTNRGVRSN